MKGRKRRLGPRGPRPAPAECKRIFARLSDYLDGALDRRTCAKLERHLGTCAPCLVFLRSVSETMRLCRAYGRAALPANLRRAARRSFRHGEKQLRQRLLEWGARRRQTPRR